MPLNVKNGWLGSFLLEMVLSDTSVPQLLFPTYQPTSEYCLGLTACRQGASVMEEL